MLEKYKISVVIPTFNRPAELKHCLSNIADQTSPPKEVIIIDDGTEHLSPTTIRDVLPTCVSVVITESEGEPGTSAARNTGAQLASSKIVLILDDDVFIEESYLERLRGLYISHDNPELAGIGGYDADIRIPSAAEQLFNTIFYLSTTGWNLNRVGMQSWDSVDELIWTDWLSGNNASYKRSVLLDFPFPHWEGGRESLEDVAMGMQLKCAGYRCIIDPQLSLTHKETGTVEGDVDFGLKRGKNRIRIFRHWGTKWLWPLFLWAYFGDTIRHFIAPAIDGKFQTHWQIGYGMLLAPIVYAVEIFQSKINNL